VTAATVARAGGRGKYLTLVAMTGALSMILIDETVVSVALPSIQRSLDLSATALQWVMNGYLLVIAAFVALAGRISDMLGRTRTFLIGVIVFVVCSMIAGISTEGWHIISARAVQGVGAALMIPSSQAIVTNAFPVEERGRAMGIYAGISLAFLALGPLIGGILTEHFGWEWVFFINVPVGVATIALTLAARPAGARMPPEGRFDWLGGFLLVAGLAASVFGLMQSSAWGWSSPSVALPILGGVLGIALFVLVELHRAHPLIELSLFRSGNFTGDNIVLFIVQFALMGVSVFGSIFVQDALGFSPVEAGLALLPLTIPMLIMAPRVGRLYDRLGARGLVTGGSLAAALGFLGSAIVVTRLEYWWFVPGYVALGIGIAFIMTPANTDGMNAAPAAQRGEASGVLQAVRQLGGTLGVATLTSIVLSRTRTNLAHNLGISEAQADKLDRTLSEAKDGTLPPAASDVPESTIDQVVDAMKDAFASSLRLAYLVVVVVLVLGTVVAFTMLRRIRFTDEAAGETPEPVPPHPLAAHAHAPAPAPADGR
jgi:EmrB/QacA subfamily drug resistance transporter